MTVTLNEINCKLNRMLEQTTDLPSHQSPKIKQKIKADYDNKQFRSLIKQDRWKDYIKAEIDEGQPDKNLSGSLMYSIDKGYANDFKGYYVHPILINYIAICISPKYAVTVRKIMDSINENSQQTHTTFEANTSRLIEQLQRENTDYSNTIQQMTPRLVPQDKQYDYIYSVELINEDIDGKGIIMKNLGFTIPNDQDVDEIMNQIRQTITERSIN
ncbi:MAG: hypothetical protein EZS28_030758 [Streblomastix strix]|uniref:KilA-N domain-containing protein n=1 Tax=Streblomastix strix TaxID=222440 RepID=A0A5J4USU7_9EUKA|nr:MAG: hypothetical protein EZS28_030758 [Streblomastix strix]